MTFLPTGSGLPIDSEEPDPRTGLDSKPGNILSPKRSDIGQRLVKTRA